MPLKTPAKLPSEGGACLRETGSARVWRFRQAAYERMRVPCEACTVCSACLLSFIGGTKPVDSESVTRFARKSAEVLR
jgi:hypothetical protein